MQLLDRASSANVGFGSDTQFVHPCFTEFALRLLDVDNSAQMIDRKDRLASAWPVTCPLCPPLLIQLSE